MNNNEFDKKRITVPIPKFKTSEDIKREQEEMKKNLSFPKFDYEEFSKELNSRKHMKDGYRLQIPKCKSNEDEYETKSGFLDQNRPNTINSSLGDFTAIYENQQDNVKVKKLTK